MGIDRRISNAELNSLAVLHLFRRLESVEIEHQRVHEAVFECEVPVNDQIFVVLVHSVQQLTEYSHYLLFRWRRASLCLKICLQRADGAKFLDDNQPGVAILFLYVMVRVQNAVSLDSVYHRESVFVVLCIGLFDGYFFHRDYLELVAY